MALSHIHKLGEATLGNISVNNTIIDINQESDDDGIGQGDETNCTNKDENKRKSISGFAHSSFSFH
eukprot:10324621-Ditylum_brightwellii.AAC.1